MESLNNYEKLKANGGLRKLGFASVVALCLTVIGFFCYAFSHPFSQSQVAEITETWTYYPKNSPDSTFKSRYVKHLPQIRPNQIMVMERKMKTEVENPMLLIQGNHQWIKVTIDDHLIYEYTPTSTGRLASDNPGKSLKEIQLPADYLGSVLKVEVASPYQSYSGLPARVFVGEANSLMAYIFTLSIPQVLMMILGISISVVLLLIVGRTLKKQQRLDVQLLLLAAFAMTIGLEAAASDIVAGLLFSPIVNSTVAIILAALSPLFLIVYYCHKMTVMNTYYKYWVIPHLIFSLSLLISVAFTPLDMPEIKPWIDAVNLFGTLAITIAAICESHQKNRFYVFCTPWIVLVALAHCFLYIMEIMGTPYNHINFSGLFFIVILLVIFIYTVSEFLTNEEKNRKQMNFLEVKTALLEESREEMNHHLAEVEQIKKAFRKNLQMMQLLVEDGNLTGTQEYLAELMEDTKRMDGLPRFTEHSLTNLILSRYQKLAEKRSIDTSFNIVLPPTIAITDTDLTKLFAHLLEHAFRETYAITDPSQRKITLQVYCDQGKIHFYCEHTANYYENIFDRGINTDLPEKEEFDLWVLEKISKKYAGALKKSNTEKTDSVAITLSV